MRIRFLLLAVLALSVAIRVAYSQIISPKPPAPYYFITDLNIVIHTSESGPRSINAAGEIVGTTDTAEGGHLAFLYRNGKVTLLGTLGGEESHANALNDKGQIVGIAQSGDGRMAAFLWERGQMREIKPMPTFLGGPDHVQADAINNKGQVIGSLIGMHGIFTAFLWQNGALLSPPPNASDFTLGFVPVGLNDRGQIVGVKKVSSFTPIFRAVLWDGSKHQSLGTLIPDGTSYPRAINNKEQVVGVASTEYIYQDHAFLWDSGRMRELEVAGSSTSGANGINNKGQVVGEASLHYEEHNGNDITFGDADRAILWQNGKASNLNDLIPKEAGWILEKAVDINDRGQIVGIGHRSQDGGKTSMGGWKAFLLTPVKQKHSGGTG